MRENSVPNSGFLFESASVRNLSKYFQWLSLKCQASVIRFFKRNCLPNIHVRIATVCRCLFKCNGGPWFKGDFVLFDITEPETGRAPSGRAEAGLACGAGL